MGERGAVKPGSSGSKRRKVPALKTQFTVLSDPIVLTSEDLETAAADCGLTIKPDVQTLPVARHITLLLMRYISRVRGKKQSSSATDQNTFFDELDRWATYGRDLLGFAQDEDPHAPLGDYRAAEVQRLLISSLIQTKTDSAEYQDLRHMIVDSVGQDFLLSSGDTKAEIANIEQALRNLSAVLKLISTLSKRKHVVTKGPPAKDAERELIYDLGNCFEALHTDEHHFTYSKRNEGAELFGPALDWCRFIFQRVQGRTEIPEIDSLVRWSKRTTAIPELMDQWSERKVRTARNAKLASPTPRGD